MLSNHKKRQYILWEDGFEPPTLGHEPNKLPFTPLPLKNLELTGIEPIPLACKTNVLPLNYNPFSTKKKGLEPLLMILEIIVLPIKLLFLRITRFELAIS